jgi:hypothetical protein
MGKKPKDIPDEVLFSAVYSLIEGESVTTIVEELAREFSTDFTREQIYPMLRRARQKGLLELQKPEDQVLAGILAKKCGLDPDNVRVIRVRGLRALDHVAESAAQVVFELIEKFRTNGEPFHIASGAGRTAYLVSRSLGALLTAQLPRAGQIASPEIVFHALTGGWDPEAPLDFASAQFSCFIDEDRPYAGFVGLSAPPVVPCDLFDQIRVLPFVETSFTRASEIELVYTSIGSESDEHCSFTKVALHPKSSEMQKELRDAGWVGDCQYQPYSRTSAITGIRNGVQAFAVLTLADLKIISRAPRKAVVIVAGPCGRCGKSRAKALAPLVGSLHVGSHLVLDIKTAEELNALLPT